MISKADLRPAVRKILKYNMALRDGETILVVNDVPSVQEWNKPFGRVSGVVERSLLARQVYEIILEEFGDHKVSYLAYYSLGQHGMELPEEVGKAMAYYDVILAINTYSISHTVARQAACNKGARVASLPEIEPEMFLPDGPLNVDYETMRANTLKVAEILSRGNKVKIVAPNGTELYFNIAGREGRTDIGLIHEKGDWGNLPGGEACIAPVEGTAFGRLVVSAGWHPNLDEDMTLVFEEGEVVEVIGGGKVGDYFRNVLNPSVREPEFSRRRNCAEFGVGTNPNARRQDNVLEAEKIKGTIHIAVGDNSHLGGIIASDIHEDFVLGQPDVYVDDICLLRSGKLFWEE